MNLEREKNDMVNNMNSREIQEIHMVSRDRTTLKQLDRFKDYIMNEYGA